MHLHVVVTNECSESSFLFVPITTIYPGKYFDTACVFAGGEHDFIVHPSYVDYSRAQLRFSIALHRCLDTGSFPSKPDLAAVELGRGCTGISTSTRCQPWAKAKFASNIPY